MAFDYLKFEKWSQSDGIGINDQWAYTKTDETLAAINTAGYFNNINNGNPDAYLDINDVMWIVGSDGATFATVTAVTPNVITVPFSVVLGAGSVGTVNIANGAVGTTQLADDAVTSAKLAEDTIQYINVTVSAAEWLAMFATPKLLIAAPGANKVIRVKEVSFEVDYGGVPFVGGGVTALQYNTTAAGAGVKASATVAAATVTGWVADALLGTAGDLANSAPANVVNQGVYLSNATAAFTAGTSVINVHISYNVITTAF